MKRVTIMMDRIRDQVGTLPQLKSSGTLRATAEMVPGPPAADERTLEQQVWAVADHVTEIIQQGLQQKVSVEPKVATTEKEKHKYAHGN
jgi:hypothetical protein